MATQTAYNLSENKMCPSFFLVAEDIHVARAWTYETACALGIENEIDPNLPWNDYFEWFGPRYRLEVPENNMEDLNTKDGSLDIIRCVHYI
jgi:hypothetical protein